MAHKAYRWVDPMGRVTTPPLDPMEVMEQRARGVLNEADERKVSAPTSDLLPLVDDVASSTGFWGVASDVTVHLRSKLQCKRWGWWGS